VTFFDGPNLLATVPVGSGATATYATSFASTGAHTITAAYNGNANCDASNDTTTVQVTVAPPPPGPGGIVINPNPVAAGGELTVSDGRMICKRGTESAIAWSDGFKNGRIDLHRRNGSRGSRIDGADDGSLVGYGWATWRTGWYDVKFTCDGGRDPRALGKLHVVPRGAHTGDGASILAGGVSDTQKAGGLALFGGALGLGAYGVRRKLKAGR
jgi:hypothetical protein